MEKRRSNPGQGSIRRDGNRKARRILISFDDDTFDQIRTHALTTGLSFSGAVRELVEFGLIDVADDQRDAA